MKRNINAQARLVNCDHRRVTLPECTIAQGEIRVDPQDRDVETISVNELTGFATFRPLRGQDQTEFEAPCAEAATWQLIGGFPEEEEDQFVA